MKNIDAIDFEILVEKAINSGKDSISFQIYGYNNQWVCDMVDGLPEYLREAIDYVGGAEINFKD